MRTELPTGTVTFLFTDIEGSTRLLHALGPDAYAEALAEHRRVLRAAFAHTAASRSTRRATRSSSRSRPPRCGAAARAGQEALAPARSASGWACTPGRRPSPPKATSASTCIAVRGWRRSAHGGQVLLTEATAALLDGRDAHRPRSPSAQGLRRRHTLFQLGTSASLRCGRPEPSTCRRPRRASSAASASSSTRVSLVLEHDPRILTIVGPGGTGKTRFSLELARLLAEDADGGTVFVPFAATPRPELVLPAIAERLGATAPARRDRRTGRRAGERTSSLDNLEQLLPDSPGALALAVGRPSLRLLVTSREPLRIAGETRARSSAARRGRGRRRSSSSVRTPSVPISSRPPRSTSSATPRRTPARARAGRRPTKLLAPEQLLERIAAAARPAQGHPRRRRASRDAASDDRLVATTSSDRRAGAVRPARRLPWRLHARGRGGGLRRRPRHARVAARQEPPPPARRRGRRRPLLDARDDPRVRRGGAPERAGDETLRGARPPRHARIELGRRRSCEFQRGSSSRRTRRDLPRSSTTSAPRSPGPTEHEPCSRPSSPRVRGVLGRRSRPRGTS